MRLQLLFRHCLILGAVCFGGDAEGPAPTEIVDSRCLGEACVIMVIGDLQRNDETVRSEVLTALRPFRQGMVLLTMAENKRDWGDLFGAPATGIRLRPQIAPYISEIHSRASAKEGVVAYARDGVAEIFRWDPKKRERRRISGEPTAHSRAAGPHFEILWMAINEKPRQIRLHILAPPPSRPEKNLSQLRSWLKTSDDIALSVKFMAQKRIFDDEFPVQNPLLGDWPTTEGILRKDRAMWCQSPPRSTRKSVRCTSDGKWMLLGR